ncbi:hypothetical protein Q3G72_001391 [Acer saccharum]|nr:hypothetical protein Q3G72_001391 [Acer saccharum]
MRFDLNPLTFYKNKNNHVYVKFAVSFLLIGLAFRLLVSDSIRFSSVVETQGQINEEQSQETITESPEVAALPVQEPVPDDNETKISDNVSAKCDLFTGGSSSGGLPRRGI